MAPNPEKREALEARLAAHVLAHGLGQTSLRQLAAAAGTSDRMLLYYYADKAALLGAVLTRLAADMANGLAAALPAGDRLPAADLLARVGALAAQPGFRPYMSLWAEIAAEAGRGAQPFAMIATTIAGGFVYWVDERLAEPDPVRRRDLAALLIAVIDGAALLAPLGDGAIATRAMGALQGLLAAS
ncbi:TetR/AcrR family transcriptional regulator [Novosphingobium cyanobacteriorum]|uniref:TetR/AcrR family transcriptional regulator n=1 Tax=Novosphingobium cyanobacteriorum TaxID=3024215 RepID=A0ABT6CEK3_9SPHN|nr:TetR/AcrR family transcriptional regulator [Novosphingobium cyanobacteriorum]MDF8332345.1 TetR/AcrR family transcriptional regulator [Novosphingobium cyanobacteriorum]